MYMTQFLHRAVQQHPERIAVRFDGRHRTFRQLGERVARLAGALQALGMARGDRVAMLALNSDRYLEYQMAVPWGGGVINPCNTRWSAAEILYSLEDSGSAILLVDDAFLDQVQQFRANSSTLREVIYCGEGVTPAGMHDYETLLTHSAPVADALRRGEDLAGIFYTGGTTGFPKGVMLSHNNLCSSGLSLLAEGYAAPEATYLHAAPMFHLADMGIAMAHWMQGSTHAVIPSFSPARVLDAIEQYRANQTLLVPTMIQMLLDHMEGAGAGELSSLRSLVYGAAPMTEALLERTVAALPQVEIMQAYGMTELSPLATINPPRNYTAAGRQSGRHRSAGRPCHMVELRIVDLDGNELPRGQIGEVVVRGPNVMQGYWNRPEQTAAAIVDGWMHTGDGAYMDQDGYIYIVDRLKDMIISGGENIYSAEVENALAQHPAVAACAVVGIPSPEWGETVHAVVVRRAGADVAAADLTAHCKGMIAGYKCPRSVAFVAALPLSGAGKVLKTKLREQFWQGRGSGIV